MIEIADEGKLRIVTLNRPGKANALTRDMLVALTGAVNEAIADEDVNALVLTGAGRVFSAGADLDAAKAGLATDEVWELLSDAVASAPILTIAALNGTAAGGALGMVLACDIRVVVSSASFFYPVMKLGFLPQPSDPARLSALVGPAQAKLILMGGQKISAEDARAIGLVDRIADDALAEARAIASDALSAERRHVTAIKSMI